MSLAKSERRPIRLLDPGCVERIAAGEVVERPASVVKELVENSLDAGAALIRVRLRRGGVEEILVEDDGSGIPAREIPLAVERHATSKIAGSGDLTSILSYGFRGEALAAIASVSRFSLRSRWSEEDHGGRLDVVGGRLERNEPLARPSGTTVLVRDLFFNTPARKAFLRSEASERRAVTQVLTAIALAHPEVGFRLEAEGSVALDLPAARDLATRAMGVFGASVVERMRRFEGEAHGLRVAGLASLPTYTRGNRTGQFFYVNRRPIFDKGMAHAVSSAYREVVPGGRFPVLLVFLDVMPARVDVNVHPAKAEVRFRDEGAVHELIRHALQEALSLRHEPEETPRGQGRGEPGGRSPEAEALTRIEQVAQELFLEGSGGAQTSRDRWRRAADAPALFDAVGTGETPGRFVPEGAPVDPGLSAVLGAASPESTPLFWQLHNTFILTQIRGALVIVDQHNSHERILYNEGRKALDGRGAATQQLLFPVTLELTPAELATYEVHRGDLERVGFLTEPFGGSTVLVRGIPAEIRNWNEGAMLRDILADLGDAGHSGTDPREAILASYSCHGAIRAGERLTLPEMRSLMDRLFATELPYSCPHGRPTLIRIGLGELERRFGRR